MFIIYFFDFLKFIILIIILYIKKNIVKEDKYVYYIFIN